MTMEQRQAARRRADQRRPHYRRAALGCSFGAGVSLASVWYTVDGRMLIPSVLMAVLAGLLIELAIHFDNKSRRCYLCVGLCAQRFRQAQLVLF